MTKETARQIMNYIEYILVAAKATEDEVCRQTVDEIDEILKGEVIRSNITIDEYIAVARGSGKTAISLRRLGECLIEASGRMLDGTIDEMFQTNADKYTTAEERFKAFSDYCDSQHHCNINCDLCQFMWLEREAQNGT